MTKFTPHIGWATALTGLLVGILLAGCSSSPDAGKVGDFTPPVLTGWNQTATKGDWSEKAVYKKVTQNNRLKISLSLLKITPARSVQEMQKVIQSGGHATLSKSTKQLQVKQVLEQATNLNGMPAVLTQTIYKASRFTRNEKSLRFAKGSDTYLLLANTVVLAGSTASPQAQTEIDEAWKTIAQKLVP